MFLIRPFVFWYLRTFPKPVDESFGLLENLGIEERIKQNDWLSVEGKLSQLTHNEFSKAMAELCSGKILMEEIEAFIQSTESEFRNLIAGCYYKRVAYVKRGYGWSRDLSEDQVDGMYEYLEKATTELTKEYENKVYRAEADGRMIGVLLNTGEKEEAAYYLNIVTSIYSDHWLCHYRYFRITVPRWGGSNEEMYAYIENTSDLSIKNMLRVLSIVEMYSDLTYEDEDNALRFLKEDHQELIDEALQQKYDFDGESITNIYTLNYLAMLYNILGMHKDRDILLKKLEGKFTMHPWAYFGMLCERDVKVYKRLGILSV